MVALTLFYILFYVSIIVLVLNALFDISYCCLGFGIVLYSWIKRKCCSTLPSFMGTNTIYGICFTWDLDLMLHMNNARYLRAADLARIKFWYETGVFYSIRTIGGGLVAGAINVRYRRSLKLGDIYTINSRIVSWDEKSFYMEQTFTRWSDGFVCCIVMVKQTLVGVTVPQVLTQVSPKPTEQEHLPEVASWIQSIEQSSDRLKKLS